MWEALFRQVYMMTLQKFGPEWSGGLEDPEHGRGLTLALALQKFVLY